MVGEKETLENGDSGGEVRGEVDISAPFESVKEAVTMFGGGFDFSKHHLTISPCEMEEDDVTRVEEQAAELEKQLVVKERETLEVLNELEATKLLVEELKSNIQKEEAGADFDKENVSLTEKENNPYLSLLKLTESSNLVPSSAPGSILIEFEQDKMILTRTTSGLAENPALVESYNMKIERERILLDKTRERLRSSASKISSLQQEINRTKSELQKLSDASADKDPSQGKNIVQELQRLSNEVDEFKKIGEDVKSEVMKVMLQIEQTKAQMKTAEIRFVAARKMKEAARAAEAVALAEIAALERSEDSSFDVLQQRNEQIILTLEEYSSLKSKAQDAEKTSNLKVLEAMLQVEDAVASKMDIMKRVEEAMEEVKTSKQALEDALNRVEAANSAKLAVEEALRKWRSDNGERRRSIQSSTKFKNPYPSNRRRDSWMLDLNGVNLFSDAPAPVLKPTLSIGQILSRKLLVTEVERQSSVKRKVSLGQMLGKRNSELSSAWKLEKDCAKPKKLPAKRKKFSFSRFSVLSQKENQKKKKINFSCKVI